MILRNTLLVLACDVILVVAIGYVIPMATNVGFGVMYPLVIGCCLQFLGGFALVSTRNRAWGWGLLCASLVTVALLGLLMGLFFALAGSLNPAG